jgi:hypothetical protein
MPLTLIALIVFIDKMRNFKMEAIINIKNYMVKQFLNERGFFSSFCSKALLKLEDKIATMNVSDIIEEYIEQLNEYITRALKLSKDNSFKHIIFSLYVCSIILAISFVLSKLPILKFIYEIFVIIMNISKILLIVIYIIFVFLWTAIYYTND